MFTGRDVKFVFFPSANFVYEIRILFELYLGQWQYLATLCTVLANITKVPPTIVKDTHVILHDSC